LNLEGNFRHWLRQARADFKHLESLTNAGEINRFTEKKFALQIPQSEFEKILPFLPQPTEESRRVHVITEKPARPWCG